VVDIYHFIITGYFFTWEHHGVASLNRVTVDSPCLSRPAQVYNVVTNSNIATYESCLLSRP